MANDFPISVEARARHGALWKAHKKLGGGKALSELLGISLNTLSKWMNFRGWPGPASKRFTTDWILDAELKLELVLAEPVTLFPPEVASHLAGKNVVHIEQSVDIELITGEQLSGLPGPEACAIQAEAEEKLIDALSHLTTRECKIIEFRFGVNGQPQKTLEETARVFKVTRTRIGQVEKKALQKLRDDETLAGLHLQLVRKDA